jgi:hypothetical protein
MALRLDGAGPRGAEGLRKARCVLPDPRLVAGRAGAVVLPDDRRRDRSRRAVALVLLPRMPAVRVGRLAHARPTPRRRNLGAHPVPIVPPLFA